MQIQIKIQTQNKKFAILAYAKETTELTKKVRVMSGAL